MNQVRFFQNMSKILVISACLALLVYGNSQFYALTYFLTALLFVLRAMYLPTRKTIKFQLLTLYTLFLLFQLGFVSVIFVPASASRMLFARLLGIIFFLTPFSFENLFLNDDFSRMYFPNRSKVTTFSYEFFKDNREELMERLTQVKDMKKGITAKNLKDVITDLPRQGYLSYVNNGTLTPDYFEEAYSTLEDPYVYIVLSNTGSGASELISAFTKRNYAHSSLSFDRDLKTIISFNGGERINPPGLNHEALDFFNQKEDSSIIVYKLKASIEQKQAMIKKVEQINQEGSAYNMIGVIGIDTKKPNMLLCSQFVYVMLKDVGLEYFDKKSSSVRPTDLIELDYHRKLEFEYELFLNDRR